NRAGAEPRSGVSRWRLDLLRPSRPEVGMSVALRARYEREAGEVDRYTNASYWDRRYHQRRFDHVAELLAGVVGPTSSVLDVGCGTGEYLLAAGRLGSSQVVGIDLAHGYCRRAAELAPAARVCGAELGRLPFADDAFDVVLCTEVVEHLDPAEARVAAAELFRVARRAVVLTTPNAQATIRRWGRTLRAARVDELDAEVGHINLLDLASVGNLIAAAGWQVQDLCAVHVLPPVLGELGHLPRGLDPVVGAVERAADRFVPNHGNCILAVAVPPQ
ncbi:MAG TPA: methyltransferase domain-containing protein, partial [Acidimicrobiales bacterium]